MTCRVGDTQNLLALLLSLLALLSITNCEIVKYMTVNEYKYALIICEIYPGHVFATIMYVFSFSISVVGLTGITFYWLDMPYFSLG